MRALRIVWRTYLLRTLIKNAASAKAPQEEYWLPCCVHMSGRNPNKKRLHAWKVMYHLLDSIHELQVFTCGMVWLLCLKVSRIVNRGEVF